MTLESLTAIIKANVPRLRPWEMDRLARAIAGEDKEMKTVAVSGGFDPLHIGHVRYLEEARKIAGHLTVILNGDSFLIRKKGFVFMPQEQRAEILRSLRCVDEVVIFESEQDTVIPALEALTPDIFAKGGDRGSDNTPEAEFCQAHGIQIVYGVGGTDKPQSSQWLTDKIKEKA